MAILQRGERTNSGQFGYDGGLSRNRPGSGPRGSESSTARCQLSRYNQKAP